MDSFFVKFVCLFSFIFRHAYLLPPQPALLNKQACLGGSTFPWVEWEGMPSDVFAAATSALRFLACSESNPVRKKSKTAQ